MNEVELPQWIPITFLVLSNNIGDPDEPRPISHLCLISFPSILSNKPYEVKISSVSLFEI